MTRVGCIYTVAFRYYDIRSNQMRVKKRPFMIVKEEISKSPIDLSVLPVSSVSDKSRIDPIYDVRIDKNLYPNLNLTKDVSYIRTNKLQTINERDLIEKICDNQSSTYPDLYNKIRSKVTSYYASILDN